MPLSKKSKDKEANQPDKHIDQSRDQVFDQDANPTKENQVKEGEKVVSGRNLPDTSKESAPAVQK